MSYIYRDSNIQFGPDRVTIHVLKGKARRQDSKRLTQLFGSERSEINIPVDGCGVVAREVPTSGEDQVISFGLSQDKHKRYAYLAPEPLAGSCLPYGPLTHPMIIYLP